MCDAPVKLAAARRAPDAPATWALRIARVGTVLTNRSAPPVTVTPVLAYPDVHAAVAWLGAASGFQERVRIGDAHRAQLSIGEDGAVVVADVRGERVKPEFRSW